jgi:hypothetical protein
MTEEMAKFGDDEGREWTATIQWGHPAPGELGIVAVRFECADPAEAPRVGFALQRAIAEADQEELREALANSEPARAIG